MVCRLCGFSCEFVVRNWMRNFSCKPHKDVCWTAAVIAAGVVELAESAVGAIADLLASTVVDASLTSDAKVIVVEVVRIVAVDVAVH